MRPPARAAATLAATGALLVPLAAPAAACPRPEKIVVTGPTRVYDPAYTDVRTRIVVVRTEHRTSVRLAAAGFPRDAAGKTFGVHVHVNPCGPKPEDAGPHYQNPDAPPDAPMHDKEIWLDVTVREDGTGRSGATVPWRVAPKAAGSVVVHALPTDHDTGGAGARTVCTTVPF